MATLQQISEFMAESFPQSKVSIAAVDAVSATVRHRIGIEELRPGGTVAGPVIMAVADAALYVAIFGPLGCPESNGGWSRSLSGERTGRHARQKDYGTTRLRLGAWASFRQGAKTRTAHVKTTAPRY